jgi:uncharacterized protein (TIGR02679 family)
VSNGRKRAQAQKAKVDFFTAINAAYKTDSLKQWLSETINNPMTGCNRWMSRCYNENAGELAQTLTTLQHVVTLIETATEGILRPVVAALITKDPHSLDDHTQLLKALEYYLSFRFGVKEPVTAEERTNLLAGANIMNDTGSRTVITYGLEACDACENKLGWENFYQRNEPMVLTLLNFLKVSSIDVCHPNNGVYCFENPAVFYTMIQQIPNMAAVCVGGQVNLAAYKLFELFEKNGIKTYYHGDFDPEGLLIAEKLLQRFKTLALFGYNEAYYMQAMSGKRITEKRLKQCDQLTTQDLVEMGKLIKKHQRAGYEEYLIDQLLREVRSSFV